MELKQAYSIPVATDAETGSGHVTAVTAAGSDLVIATADGIVQVSRLLRIRDSLLRSSSSGSGSISALLGASYAQSMAYVGQSISGGAGPFKVAVRRSDPNDPAPMIFTTRAHPAGTAIVMVDAVVSPAGGIVVVSLGHDGSVIVTPVTRDPRQQSASEPGTTAITAVFAPELLVAGTSDTGLWVWNVESERPPVRAEIGGDATAIVWIQGLSQPTLLVGRPSGPAGVYRYNGRLSEMGTVEIDGGVKAAVSFPGEGWSSLVVADSTGALTLCRIDAAAEKLGPQRKLQTGLLPIKGLSATRGLLAAVGDRDLVLWETEGSGQATIPLEDRPSRVVLLRARSGDPAAAWIDQAGDAKVAGIDLARTGDRRHALRLSGDAPKVPGDLDLLDFETYARPMSILIADRETPTPLVMAIDGAWGTGKTSLGRMVDAELPRSSERSGDEIGCETLWFDAWMHDDGDNLAAAMASAISAGLQRLRPWWLRLVSPSPTTAASLARRWTPVVSTLAWIVAGLLLIIEPTWLDNALGRVGIKRGATLFSFAGFSVTAGALRFVGLVRSRFSDALDAFVRASTRTATEGRIGEVRAQLGRRIHESAGPIPDPTHPSAIPGFDRIRQYGLKARRRWLFRPIPALIRRIFAVRQERRIVLFVDNLDRCRPERAVEACETLSQLLDHPRLVAVVMVDLDALAADAEVVFEKLAAHARPGGPGWGRRFLDKIFQFEFTIPAHRLASLSTLLRASMGADRAPISEVDPSPPPTAAGAGLATVAPLGLAEEMLKPSDPLSLLGSGPVLGTSPSAWAVATPKRFKPSFQPDNSGTWLEMATLPLVGVVAVVADSSVKPWLKIAVLVGAVVILGVAAVVRVGREFDLSKRTYRSTGSEQSPLRSVPDTPPLAHASAADESHGTPPEGAAELTDVSQEAAVAVERRDEIRAVLREGDHLDLGQREAERWLGGASPRTAKRLANRLLFTLAVATDRELLWTESPLDGQLIGRWVTLVELWPTVAGFIRRDPSILVRLEAAASEPATGNFVESVAGMGASGPDVLALRDLLLATPRLSNHADALIRLAQ